MKASIKKNLEFIKPLATAPLSDTGDAVSRIVPTISSQYKLPATELINKLSFSHFAELLAINDD